MLTEAEGHEEGEKELEPEALELDDTLMVLLSEVHEEELGETVEVSEEVELIEGVEERVGDALTLVLSDGVGEIEDDTESVTEEEGDGEDDSLETLSPSRLTVGRGEG